MDKFFDISYERDQAGERHHYLAARWDHRFQEEWISYVVLDLVITRAYTVSTVGHHQLAASVARSKHLAFQGFRSYAPRASWETLLLSSNLTTFVLSVDSIVSVPAE